MVLFSLTGCATVSDSAISLKTALNNAVQDITNNLPKGTKGAVVSFVSNSPQFSDIIIDEINVLLAKEKNIIVVDRKDLKLIEAEMNFQLSGEVDDDSAQSIGKKIGAQSIITGSLIKQGKNYRFTLKTINVETAVIESITSFLVNKDNELDYYLSGNESQQEDSGNRYIETKGGFSIEIPNGWDLKSTTDSVYKILQAPLGKNGNSPTVIFSVKTVDGSLSLNEIIDALSNNTKNIIPEFPVDLRNQFTTNKGLIGERIVSETTESKIFDYMDFVSVDYYFLNKNKIYNVTGYSISDENSLLNLIELFDSIIKTFEILK
jgi:TolB-like protein